MPEKPADPLAEEKKDPIKQPAAPAVPAADTPEKADGSRDQMAEDGSDVEDGDVLNDRLERRKGRKPGKPVVEGAGPTVAGTDLPYTIKSDQQREKTAAYLAYSLMGILALTIILQYIAPNEQLFNTLLPILSGLVGSAITYYFTKEARSS